MGVPTLNPEAAIADADRFFRTLLEKIGALATLNRPHPLSAKLATVTIKKYLGEERFRIQLEDLFMVEVERAAAAFRESRLAPQGSGAVKEMFQAHLRTYEVETEITLHLGATLTWYDEGRHSGLLTRALDRWGEVDQAAGYDCLVRLRLYPCLLLCYAAGVASVGARRYEHLPAILRHPRLRSRYDRPLPFLHRVNVWDVLRDAEKFVPRPNADREHTPGSNYLFDVLRPILKPMIPSDVQYERAFDTFEFVLGLSFAASYPEGGGRAPVGCFGWRESAVQTLQEFLAEGGKAQSNWELLRAGIIAQDVEGFHGVLEAYQGYLDRVGREWDAYDREPGGLLRAYESASGWPGQAPA